MENFKIKVVKDIPSDWDEFLYGGDFVDLFASSEYIRYLKYIGNRIYTIEAYSSENKVFQLMCIIKKGHYELDIISGPFITNHFTLSEPCAKKIVSKINHLIKKYCILKSKITFDYINKINVDILKNELLKQGFREEAWATFILDVQKNDEELFASFKKSARNKIKQTIKNIPGYVFNSIDSNDFEHIRKFYNVMNENRRRNNLKEYDINKVYRPMKCYKAFKIEADGKILAVQGIFLFNKVIAGAGIGLSDYACENKINAGDIIKWEVIKWARDNGYKYYDFSGVNPNPDTEKEAGIRAFKEKWGGEYVEYKVLVKEAHIYKLLKKLRRYFLSLLR
ncbi:MAG: peptidoglycan bridge formation glycyltransferase FemA/FemB family protein [Clostridia bacterium]|nr:peptidoglycan bridge formation glycyltransferase FemA/FemB family protein [Clostridia bacterium]